MGSPVSHLLFPFHYNLFMYTYMYRGTAGEVLSHICILVMCIYIYIYIVYMYIIYP